MPMTINAVISNPEKSPIQEPKPEPDLIKTVSDEVSNKKGVFTGTKPPGPARHTFSEIMNNCTINIPYN